jgi:hypothetical protein
VFQEFVGFLGFLDFLELLAFLGFLGFREFLEYGWAVLLISHCFCSMIKFQNYQGFRIHGVWRRLKAFYIEKAEAG